MPDATSPSIRYVGYDEERACLTVTFMTGRIDRYEGVPAELAQDFLAAPEKGAFLKEKIRTRFRPHLTRGR